MEQKGRRGTTYSVRKGDWSAKLDLEGLEDEGDTLAVEHGSCFTWAADFFSKGHHPFDTSLGGVRRCQI